MPLSQRTWKFLRRRGSSSPSPDAVLFDAAVLVDSSAAPAAGDRAADLVPGTIARHAFQHPSHEAALLGLITERKWVDGVRRRLAEEVGTVPASAAVRAWRAERGHLNGAVADVVRRVQDSGVRCAVLANATDSLHTVLNAHRLNVEAFPSAELAVTMPSPLAFVAVADRMGLHPEHMFFAAAQPVAVTGARAAGMEAGSAAQPSKLRARLADLGIPVRVLAAA
ncbi:hypothetical protein ACFV4P_02840 [Kitasatospora sp. NPDC059795]|uniref:hypothetical protein n=1 Tax=Kitasatospora sp. NPDC059795 TaxID=3346949 RepID=UPI00365C1580